MKKIAFLNQKGGVGKTMLATNIACFMTNIACKKTLLVDTDKQGTSRDWLAKGRRLDIDCIGMDRPQQLHSLDKFSNYDICIIDAASGLSTITIEIIKNVDILIIPIQPSPYDIWATHELVEIITRYTALKPTLKAYFVLNMKRANTNICDEAMIALKNHNAIQTLNVGTHLRVAYQECAANGLSVLEGKDNKAAHEIIDIGNIVLRLLEDSHGQY